MAKNNHLQRALVRSVVGTVILLGSQAAHSQPQPNSDIIVRAQTTCPRTGSDFVDQGYRFVLDSFGRRLPDRSQIQFCFLNNHPVRGVWIDWPAAGLKGWIKPGSRAALVRTAAASKTIEYKDSDLWYGTLPTRHPVQSPTFSQISLNRRVGANAPFASSGYIPLQKAGAPDRSLDLFEGLIVTGVVDVPKAEEARMAIAVAERGLYDKGTAAAIKTTRIRSTFEQRPDALFPFKVDFSSLPSGSGQSRTLTYRFVYEGSDRVFLQVENVALHEMLFGRRDPFLTLPSGIRRLESKPIPAGFGVSERATKLLILAPDRRTVLATMSLQYLMPVLSNATE